MPLRHPRSRMTPSGTPFEPLERRSLLSTALFVEGFEATTLTGWTTKTYSGDRSAAAWGTNTAKSYAGDRSAYVAGAGRSTYADDQHDALRRSNISLAGYGTAKLYFKYYLNTEAGYDVFSINVIGADGSTRRVFQDSGDDSDEGWQSKTISLNSVAGQQGLTLEFRFDSDSSFVPGAPSGVWVDDVRLLADPHAATGTIRGSVYEDADGDRVRDTGEGPLSGWTVYLDQNQNRRRDSGEAWRSTDSGGRYTFTGLAPGTYYVAQEVKSGFTQTSPRPVDVIGPSAFDIALSYGTSEFNSARRAAFAAAAARWERVIVGDLPDVTDDGTRIDDVAIDAAVTDIDGPGGVVAQASPSAFRDGPGTRRGLPYRGYLEIDRADLATLERNGRLEDVVAHEMAHVLGFGTFWEENDLVDGGGSDEPRFVGPVAVAQYNSLFGRSSRYVPLEDGGGPGTHDSHWRESAFRNELMTGFVNAGGNPLSRVSVGSMADLGYVVNLAAAEAYVPPGADPVQATGNAAYPVTLGAGRTRSNIDFGNRRNVAPATGSISGSVFRDADGDGRQDAGETPLAGWKVYLDANNNGRLDSTERSVVTDAAGRYTFTSLAAGDHRVRPWVPTGFTITSPSSWTHVVRISAGGSVTGKNFAAAPLAAVTGRVFHDADGNGSRGTTEFGLGGWRVFADANNNGVLDTGERSVLTSDGGTYSLGSLRPGTYTVRLQTQSGWRYTVPSNGTRTATVTWGQTVSGNNFGVTRTS